MNDSIQSFDFSKYKVLDEKILLEKDGNGNDVKTIIKIVEMDKDLKKEESVKRALKKYREKNKEELNKKISENNKIRYQTDENYREYVRQKRREYYAKNKK
jgi:hypothetical protein